MFANKKKRLKKETSEKADKPQSFTTTCDDDDYPLNPNNNYSSLNRSHGHNSKLMAIDFWRIHKLRNHKTRKSNQLIDQLAQFGSVEPQIKRLMK